LFILSSLRPFLPSAKLCHPSQNKQGNLNKQPNQNPFFCSLVLSNWIHQNRRLFIIHTHGQTILTEGSEDLLLFSQTLLIFSFSSAQEIGRKDGSDGIPAFPVTLLGFPQTARG